MVSGVFHPSESAHLQPIILLGPSPAIQYAETAHCIYFALSPPRWMGQGEQNLGCFLFMYHCMSPAHCLNEASETVHGQFILSQREGLSLTSQPNL